MQNLLDPAAHRRDGVLCLPDLLFHLRAFERNKVAPHLDVGQAVFRQFPQVSHRAGAGEVKLLTQLFVLAAVLGARVDEGAVQPQLDVDLLQKGQALLQAVQQSDLEVLAGNLDRHGRKSRAGADVDQAGALRQLDCL